MTSVWVEVFDAAGNRLGDGPITTVQTLSVTRALDGAGSFQLSALGTDPKVVAQLDNERRLRVYLFDGAGERRLLVVGIIRNLTMQDSAGGWNVQCDGPDEIAELGRISMGIGQRWENDTLLNVNSALTTAIAGQYGWNIATESAVSGTPITARVDALSVMETLTEVTRTIGLHWRQTVATQKTVTVGEFGDVLTDFRLIGPVDGHLGRGVYDNQNIGLIESITEINSSEAVVNRLYVLGSGENADAAFNLAASTRTTPYTIVETTVNGRDVTYIEDATSISDYGVIEDWKQWNVAPLSNTAAAEEEAANFLYDQASTYLGRNAVLKREYRVSLKKVGRRLNPGDKIQVIYKGNVLQQDGSVLTYRDIDEAFWIHKVTESVSQDGETVSLELSNVDTQIEGAVEIVANSIDQIRVESLSIQPAYDQWSFGPEVITIDSASVDNDTVTLVVENDVYRIIKVTMRVRSKVFESQITGTQSGGGAVESSSSDGTHRHLMFQGLTFQSGQVWVSGQFNASSDSTQTNSRKVRIDHQLGTNAPDLWTWDADGAHTHTVNIPAHTHPMSYGKFQDTVRPGAMNIDVNGTRIATGVGSTGTDFDQTYDITAQVLAKAGGIVGTHDVDIVCGSGRGRVLVTFSVRGMILPFQLT